uniref:UPF0420 protein C16orf58 homolog n=1 Tax=Rhizophora mucronata TaxID=61149 RepID=A0A2P2LIK1_RHIMU
MEKTQNDKRSSKLVIEEWNGSSSTKLCKTATITATSLLSLSIQRSGSPFHHIWRRVLQAFVPEAKLFYFFFPYFSLIFVVSLFIFHFL